MADYHIKLSDGKDTIGLIAVDTHGQPNPNVIGRNPVERSSLKTSTGNQKYSDLQPPYTALAQDDWSGGRACPDLDLDSTRFLDSLRVNTERPRRVILSGRETYSTGLRSADQSLPGSMKMVPLVASLRRLRVHFTAGEATARTLIWLWVRRKGTPAAALTVGLYSISGGTGTKLQEATLDVDDLDPLVSEFIPITISSETPTQGNEYAIYASGDADDNDENHWEVGCNPAVGSTYQSDDDDPGTWTAAGVDMYFRLTDAGSPTDAILFEYRRTAYRVTKPADGVSAASLYINGDRGVAIANTGELTLLKAGGTPGWTADEWIGCVVLLLEGTGADESQNWRVITDNDTDTLTVDTPWLVEHDTTTVYVILGSNKWTEVTGHGLTAPVTDVLVINNITYFAQGEAAAIQRMREYNNSGTWDRDFDNDGTNKAVFLEEYNVSGNVGIQIIKSTADCHIKRANKADWGTDLVFGACYPTLLNATTWADNTAYDLYDMVKPSTYNGFYYQCAKAGNSGDSEPTWSQMPNTSIADDEVVWIAYKELQFTADKFVEVGDISDRITNLVRYVDAGQNEAIWVMKEAGPWMLVIDPDTGIETVDRVKVAEMGGVRSEKNGKVAVTAGVFLYFTVMQSLHRFFHPNLDEIGPTLDEGLPAGRQGPVSAAVAYPGRIFIAVDGGATGYSCILSSAGSSSWHEMYRAPLGQRINAMYIQVIPGASPDRLWLQAGADLAFLPLPSETFDPYQDSSYPFVHEGVLVLSSIFAGLQDAYKYWKSLKIHAENLDAGVCWMEADYRLDGADDWIPMLESFNLIPMDQQEFGDEFGISGKKIDVRLRFYSINSTKTPKLLAWILSAVTVTEPKFAFSLTTKVTDTDLEGKVDRTLLPHEKVALLDEWAGTARPLVMECKVNPLFDNLKVFLLPAPIRPLLSAERSDEHTYICTILVQEA